MNLGIYLRKEYGEVVVQIHTDTKRNVRLEM